MIFTTSSPVNATSYRSFDQDYRNDTVYGIMVTISMVSSASGGSSSVNAYVNGNNVAEFQISTAPSGKGIITFYVPPKSTYRVTGGSNRKRSWIETFTSVPDPGYVIETNTTGVGAQIRNTDKFQQLHLVTFTSQGGQSSIKVDGNQLAIAKLSEYTMYYTVAVFLAPDSVLEVAAGSKIRRWFTYRFSGIMTHTPPSQAGWDIAHNVTTTSGSFPLGTYQLTLNSPVAITSTDWFIEGDGVQVKTDPMNTFAVANSTATAGRLTITSNGTGVSRPYLDVGCIANGNIYISTRIRLRNTNPTQNRLSIVTLNTETPTVVSRQKLVRSYILRYEALGMSVNTATWSLPKGTISGVTLTQDGILTIQPLTPTGTFEVQLTVNNTITRRGLITIG